MQTQIENVLSKLEKVRRNGSGYQALCPGHEDENPSLSIDAGNDGRVLLYCHAGCTFESILNALGMNAKELMPENGQAVNGSPETMNIKEVYDYRDEQGKLVYQTVRLDPKTFRARRPSGQGGYIWNLKENAPRFLYHLPELVNSDSKEVLLTEGERDCDTAIKNGFTATTNEPTDTKL